MSVDGSVWICSGLFGNRCKFAAGLIGHLLVLPRPPCSRDSPRSRHRIRNPSPCRSRRISPYQLREVG